MSEYGEADSPQRQEAGGESPPLRTVKIQDRSLTFEQASKCLNTLGKDESGLRYAYLKMTATERKLTDISMVLNFRHLLFIDVSGNYLTLDAIQVLSDMPFLVQIIAQRNFIESTKLKSMCYLQELSMSRNQIKDTQGLRQTELQFLDLNYNQIYQLQFESEDLPKLKELEVRGNYLFEFGGTLPDALEKLYLGENRISRVITSEICKLQNLQVLHLRNNQIRKLNGFSECLKNLKYINLRQNRINKVRQFRKLACLPNLQTLLILQNPVSIGAAMSTTHTTDEARPESVEEIRGEGTTEHPDPNRIPLLVLLPNLIRINKLQVSFDEREKARLAHKSYWEDIMNEESSEEEGDAPTTTTDFMTDIEMNDTDGDGDN